VKTLLRWPVVILALAGVALAVMRPNVLGSFGSGSEPARPHKPPALQTGYHTRHTISFESTWTLPSTPVQIIYWRGNIPTVVTQTDLERGLKGRPSTAHRAGTSSSPTTRACRTPCR
jgi:hypothetical protein